MKEPVYFLKLELENVRCFSKYALLDLSDGAGNWKKWTIVLGDNGTGKSTILQAIAGFEQIEMYYHNNVKSNSPSYVPKIFAAQKNISFQNNSFDTEAQVNLTFSTGGLSTFTQSKNNKTISSAIGLNNEIYETALVFGYGATRTMSPNSITEIAKDNSETLFDDDAKLINAEEWLLQLDYAASKDSEIKEFAINKRNQVKQILLDLLPDIEAIKFTTPTKENLKSKVEFRTPFGWVTIHQLSLGYKTMVA